MKNLKVQNIDYIINIFTMKIYNIYYKTVTNQFSVIILTFLKEVFISMTFKMLLRKIQILEIWSNTLKNSKKRKNKRNIKIKIKIIIILFLKNWLGY